MQLHGPVVVLLPEPLLDLVGHPLDRPRAVIAGESSERSSHEAREADGVVGGLLSAAEDVGLVAAGQTNTQTHVCFEVNVIKCRTLLMT